MKKKLLYFNALFDLELGEYTTGSIRRSAAEMTVLFAPVGTESDRILFDVNVDDAYRDYLKSYDINTPVPIYNDNCTGYEGSAWGWNEESKVRLEKLGALCNTADLNLIRTINSRKFCSMLGNQFDFGVPNSMFCSTKEQFQIAFDLLKDKFPVVIKPAFGGSGFGFIHLNKQQDFVSFLDTILSFKDGAVVEPWCNKLYDLSSVCIISPEGNISNFRYQRAYTNSRGTFFGIYFEKNDPIIENWKKELESASYTAAQKIAESGYFGPIGFDSFIYEENGKEKLASIIEINARHVMSDIAHAIRTKCASEKFSFFRLLNRKRSKLPKSYKELNQLLHGINFENGRGCILITPLEIQHNSQAVQPYRNAFFISADSKDDLWNIDKELRVRTGYPEGV